MSGKENETPKTPLKTSNNNNQPGTPGEVAEDVFGHLISVGPTEKSRASNKYYMLAVQVSKTEITSITIMDRQGNPSRESFLPHVMKSLHFKSVYPGEGSYFYSTSNRSKWEEVTELPYRVDDMTISLQAVQQMRCGGRFHIKAMIKWLGVVKRWNE